MIDNKSLSVDSILSPLILILLHDITQISVNVHKITLNSNTLLLSWFLINSGCLSIGLIVLLRHQLLQPSIESRWTVLFICCFYFFISEYSRCIIFEYQYTDFIIFLFHLHNIFTLITFIISTAYLLTTFTSTTDFTIGTLILFTLFTIYFTFILTIRTHLTFLTILTTVFITF